MLGRAFSPLPPLKSDNIRSQAIFHNVYLKSLGSHTRKSWSKGPAAAQDFLAAVHAQPSTLEAARTPLATYQSLAQRPPRHSSTLQAPRTGGPGRTELSSSAECLPLLESAVRRRLVLGSPQTLAPAETVFCLGQSPGLHRSFIELRAHTHTL